MLLKPGNNPLVSCVVVINTIDYDNPILSNLIHCKILMSTIHLVAKEILELAGQTN